MTLVVVAADLHLGAGGRLDDQARAWMDACEYADEIDATLLVLGDVFHRARPTPAELAAFADGLDRLYCGNDLSSDPLVRVHVIPGNHDYGERIGITAVEVIAGGRDWVAVHTRPTVIRLPGTTTRVGLLPWSPSRPTPDDLLAIARGMRADGVEILGTHWAISGSTLPNGQGVDDLLRRETIIPAGDLQAIGFDLVLSGHIHKAQAIREGMQYVGSLTPVDFSEADDFHGLAVINTERPTVADWRAIESRRFVTLTINPESGVASGLTDADLPEGALVRVKYDATPEQHRMMDASAIADAVHAMGGELVGVMPTIHREASVRGEVIDEDASAVEQVQRWLADRAGIDEATVQRMVDETARYVAEEAGS